VRNDRPTQPPPAQEDEPNLPAQISEATEDPDRIVFLSWDAPLVPDRRS
jgi:hypothetical protein